MFSLTTTPLLLGPVPDAATLQTNYPAATYPGSFGAVGSTAPYTLYLSTGSAWVNYALTQFATGVQGALASTSLQPNGGLLTQGSVDAISAAGAALLTSTSPKSILAPITADLNLGATGASLLGTLTAVDAESILGVAYELTPYTYILGQNGFGTAGVTTTGTVTMPTYIQVNGGYIYVDGCAGGGGGSGGSIDSGGGGGGAGAGVCRWPLYIPPGTVSLAIQVGRKGTGSAGSTTGYAAAGTGGAETYVKNGGYHMIRLNGTGGGYAQSTAAKGANGGVGSGDFSSASGGAGASNGTDASPIAASYNPRDAHCVPMRYPGGYGGGGGGATSTRGGNGGVSAGPYTLGGTGAGAGGGGGTAPWGISEGVPVFGESGIPGTGGNGGATPTAGTTATGFGGGGGGGGKGMAGGDGADGFLRFWM